MRPVLTFSNETAALAVLNKINQNLNVPITGVNAETGEPQPQCQKTISWTSVTKVYNQQLFYIQKPPQALLAGVAGTVEQEFKDTWQEPILLGNINLSL